MDRKNGLLFMKSLSDREKAELFDRIAGQYYDSNFGSIPKSQTDLLMFSLYLDQKIEKGMDFDDYTLGKELGLLQPAVRQLKLKKQLYYPREYEWWKVFLRYSENAFFDRSDRIIINIPDPNVYVELQHAVEELGGFTEVQLNTKLMKIPPGFFLKLLFRIDRVENGLTEKEAEKREKDFLDRLNRRYREEEKLAEKMTRENLLTRLSHRGLDLAIDILAELIPGGSFLKKEMTVIAKKLCENQSNEGETK